LLREDGHHPDLAAGADLIDAPLHVALRAADGVEGDVDAEAVRDLAYTLVDVLSRGVDGDVDPGLLGKRACGLAAGGEGDQ
jgi:hypothetical protein